jgi:hypothetical protein
MSFQYYSLRISGGLLKLMYNFNYYTNFTSILTFFVSPIINLKNTYLTIRDNHKITTTVVYFRNLSPLRKETHSKKLIYGVNEHNIKNAWKIYEQETKHKPKIGDIIEVHYTVPYEKLNSEYHITHMSYIVSYIYSSNIIFPPYDLKTLRSYHNTSRYKNGVLFASYKDKDISEETIKLAGPLGNFYSDLPSRYGIRITRNLLIDDNTEDSIEDLIITNNDGEDFRFNSNNILIIY